MRRLRSSRARRRALTLLLALGLAAVAVPAWRSESPAPAPASVAPTPPVSAGTPGTTVPLGRSGAVDNARQGTLVTAEDHRIARVRLSSLVGARLQVGGTPPYQVPVPGGVTSLALTPRPAPYTVDDLLALAPFTFTRQADGAYLLNQPLVLIGQATLLLAAPGGLTLRLASGPSGFASIVSLGGRIDIEGDDAGPVTVTSWDPTTGAADQTMADGRAYIRAIGGQFTAQRATFSDLGFATGRTGGVALTGQPVVVDPATSTGTGDVPAGTVTAAVVNGVTSTHNAYGLYVARADGVQVSNTTVSDNRLGGLSFSNSVTRSTVDHVVADHNEGDGIAFGPSSSGNAIVDSSATGNLGSGFRLDGRPPANALGRAASAPAAAGGGNSLSRSRASGNGQPGVDIAGGLDVRIDGNTVDGAAVGIRVEGPAAEVSLTGNNVTQAGPQAIAVVDGAQGTVIAGNSIGSAVTAIYLRDSVADVRDNTVAAATGRGISLVGQVDGSTVTGNRLGGTGATALDDDRAFGTVTTRANDTGAWHPPTDWAGALTDAARKPMNDLWVVIAAMMLLTAFVPHRPALAGTGASTADADPSEGGAERYRKQRRVMARPEPDVVVAVAGVGIVGVDRDAPFMPAPLSDPARKRRQTAAGCSDPDADSDSDSEARLASPEPAGNR